MHFHLFLGAALRSPFAHVQENISSRTTSSYCLLQALVDIAEVMHGAEMSSEVKEMEAIAALNKLTLCDGNGDLVELE